MKIHRSRLVEYSTTQIVLNVVGITDWLGNSNADQILNSTSKQEQSETCVRPDQDKETFLAN